MMSLRAWCLVYYYSIIIIIITGRPAQSAAMPLLFLLSGPKNGFFAPQGQHVAHINVKFMFIGAEMWEYSPKTVKISILAITLCLRGDSLQYFYEILSVCRRL